MKNNIRKFQEKLKELSSMLDGVNSNHSKVKELKQSVYVLNMILQDEEKLVSPYGPPTAIVPMSLN